MSHDGNTGEVEIPLRLLIIGDSYVGKTVLLQTYMGQPFDKFTTSTIGVGFERCTLPFGDRYIISAYLIDTSGQERFKAIISSTYRSVDCVLLCFDVTNLESFQSLDFWLAEVVQNAKPEVEIILVGTKIDNEKKRVITQDMARQWQKERNLVDYIETSSAQNINVDTAFHTALVAGMWWDMVIYCFPLCLGSLHPSLFLFCMTVCGYFLISVFSHFLLLYIGAQRFIKHADGEQNELNDAHKVDITDTEGTTTCDANQWGNYCGCY